jgi:hypothetical protein
MQKGNRPLQCGDYIGMAQRGQTRAFLFFRIFVPLAALVLAFPWTQLAQNSGADEALSSFAGVWRGTCQDGNPFVILSIKVTGRDLTGDISMANMNGDNGQCATVIDLPSPQHAMKISGAKLEGKTLSFQGSPKARFQMSLTGAQTAKLKFLGTRVEDTPWRLTRSADQ